MVDTNSDFSYVITYHKKLPAEYAAACAGQPEYEDVTIRGGHGAAELDIHNGTGDDIFIEIERNFRDPANGRYFSASALLSPRYYTYTHAQSCDLNDDGIPDVLITPTEGGKYMTIISKVDVTKPLGAGLVNELSGTGPSANIFDDEADASCSLIYGIDHYATLEEMPEDAAGAYERANKPVTKDQFRRYLGRMRSDVYIYSETPHRDNIRLNFDRGFSGGDYGRAEIDYSSDHTFVHGRGVKINDDFPLDYIFDVEEGYMSFQSEPPKQGSKGSLCLVDHTAPFPRGFGPAMDWSVSGRFPEVKDKDTPFSAQER